MEKLIEEIRNVADCIEQAAQEVQDGGHQPAAVDEFATWLIADLHRLESFRQRLVRQLNPPITKG